MARFDELHKGDFYVSTSGDVWQSTIVQESGVRAESQAAAAVELRSDILEMTQTAEDAVLRPDDPGGWPHDLRAALAARIARLNRSEKMADRFLDLAGTSRYVLIADPANASLPDDELKTCLTFVDQVAMVPRDITPHDIQNLKEAGISDADIVRLTELVAFLAYQIRVVAGLALIAEL